MRLVPFTALLLALPFCACREHPRVEPSAAASASAPAPSASVGATAADAGPPSLVREEKTVVVDGAAETWKLVWRSPPVPVSGLPWRTPIGGVFGETGDLDLVRVLPAGGEEERLNLGALSAKGTLVVAHWLAERSDFQLPTPSLEVIKTRHVAEVIRFDDYDGDGRATEFAIDLVGDAVVVGISRRNPHLHVFGTTEKPDVGLRLRRAEDWESVLKGGGAFVTERSCKDGKIGSFREVTRDPLGLHLGKPVTFVCGKGDPPQRLPGQPRYPFLDGDSAPGVRPRTAP